METNEKVKKKLLTVRVVKSEKDKLLELARDKGVDGFTGLIRLLASAKSVTIET